YTRVIRNAPGDTPVRANGASLTATCCCEYGIRVIRRYVIKDYRSRFSCYVWGGHGRAPRGRTRDGPRRRRAQRGHSGPSARVSILDGQSQSARALFLVVRNRWRATAGDRGSCPGQGTGRTAPAPSQAARLGSVNPGSCRVFSLPLHGSVTPLDT